MTGSSANCQWLQTSGGLALASLAWGVPRLHFISFTSPIEMDLKANGTNALRTLAGFYVRAAEVVAFEALLKRDLWRDSLTLNWLTLRSLGFLG